MFTTKELKKIFPERKKLTQAISTVVNQAISTIVEWANVQNKPEVFPPEDHTHSQSEISDMKNNYTATVNPIISNDNTQGYFIGSLWINTNSDTVFQCTDSTTNNAVWKIISSKITDDAPEDGNTYGRRNGDWYAFEGGGGVVEMMISLSLASLSMYEINNFSGLITYAE
jgi:hypothetical protein